MKNKSRRTDEKRTGRHGLSFLDTVEQFCASHLDHIINVIVTALNPSFARQIKTGIVFFLRGIHRNHMVVRQTYLRMQKHDYCATSDSLNHSVYINLQQKHNQLFEMTF